MGTTYFDVEFVDSPPLENRHGFPWPKPVHGTLTFLGPHGIRVLGGANHRAYLEECATALARACRGRVTRSTGKEVADHRRDEAVIDRDALLAEWQAAKARLDERRGAAQRKFEQEHADDPQVKKDNDWSDL